MEEDIVCTTSAMLVPQSLGRGAAAASVAIEEEEEEEEEEDANRERACIEEMRV
jgi:hypothetical protein